MYSPGLRAVRRRLLKIEQKGVKSGMLLPRAARFRSYNYVERISLICLVLLRRFCVQTMQKSALLSRPYTAIDVSVPSDVVIFRPDCTDVIIFVGKRLLFGRRRNQDRRSKSVIVHFPLEIIPGKKSLRVLPLHFPSLFKTLCSLLRKNVPYDTYRVLSA